MQVTVPSDPRSVGVLRTVAAGLGAMAGLDIDAIEDVILAVHEVALQLIGAGADQLTISFDASPSGLTVEGIGDRELTQVDESSDAAIGRDILEGLVDELVFGEANVRFIKRSAVA